MKSLKEIIKDMIHSDINEGFDQSDIALMIVFAGMGIVLLILAFIIHLIR